MTWDELRYFLSVAEEKSISKAANNLHISQSALSNHMKKLEHALEVNLFERSWEGISLTDEGEFFSYYTVKLMNKFDEMQHIMNSANLPEFQDSYSEIIRKDRINIGIVEGMSRQIILTIIQQLKQINSEAVYRITTAPSLEIMKLLEANKLDIGFYYEVGNYTNFESYKVIDDMFVLIVPEYLRSLSQQELKKELREMAFLLDDKTIALYVNLNSLFVAALEFSPNTFQLVDDYSVMINLVEQKEGFTLIPRLFVNVDNIDVTRVHIIPLPETALKRSVKLGFSDTINNQLFKDTILSKLQSILLSTQVQ